MLTLALVAGCSSAPPSARPPVDEPTASPPVDERTAGPSVDQPTAGPDGVAVAAVQAARLATTSNDATAAGEAVNAFGLELYARLAEGKPDANLVISPASIALALAMARAGARGATADEMDRVLHDLGSDTNAAWVAALDESFDAANQTVTQPDEKPVDIIVRSVNAPFAQAGLPLESDYLRALAERFAAGLRLVDYAGSPDGSRGVINGWVAEQTEDRIPELLGPTVITRDTCLVLVNAVYLNAPWAVPFVEDATTDADFTRLDGSTMMVPMMLQRGSIGYAAGHGWQAVDLPYLGDHLSMLVILPDDLATFERAFDARVLADITRGIESRQVSLSMPRFGAESELSLTQTLPALGMPTAFGSGADFSGITRAAHLWISDVVHQANIDVDERGTEAAAATAVVMLRSAAPAPALEVTVDHPFLFALRDRQSGAVLFLGRVTEPEPADPTTSPG